MLSAARGRLLSPRMRVFILHPLVTQQALLVEEGRICGIPRNHCTIRLQRCCIASAGLISRCKLALMLVGIEVRLQAAIGEVLLTQSAEVLSLNLPPGTALELHPHPTICILFRLQDALLEAALSRLFNHFLPLLCFPISLLFPH